MAQILLNYGSAAGDGTGDVLFDIFGDVELNFNELYLRGLAELPDTNFTSLTNNDFTVWDSASSKFINLSASALDIASAATLLSHRSASNPHSGSAATSDLDNYLALAGGTMSGAIDSTVGLFTSSVAATGNAFDFDSSNTITSGKLLNISNNGTDKLSIEQDGTNVILKGSNVGIAGYIQFVIDNIYTSYKFEDVVGNYLQLFPAVSKIITNNSFIEFVINDSDALFQVNSGAFTPSNNNTINFGTAAKTFKTAYFTGLQIGTITDLLNIQWATGIGTKFGTSSTQKIGFWNVTPVVQPSANADTSGATLTALETEVNELKQLLRDTGLMAS